MCEVTYIHEDKVNKTKKDLAEQNPMDVVRISKTSSDDTRVKVIYALFLEGELRICDVTNIIESSTAAASHYLGLLRNLGIAKHRKGGKVVYYLLSDEHVKQLVEKSFLYQGGAASIG